MSALILNDLPEPLLVRLRERAERQGRSVEAEATELLDDALGLPAKTGGGFAGALRKYLEERPEVPADEVEEWDRALENLRDPDPGRDSAWPE